MKRNNLIVRALILTLMLFFLLSGQLYSEPLKVDLILRTEPDGALVKRGLDLVGVGGKPCRFRVDDESRTVKLRFELEGYKATERTISVNDLVYRSVFPAEDQSPIILVPQNWIGKFRLWLKRNPSLATTLFFIPILLFAGWRGKLRQTDELKRWVGRMGQLLDGTRHLHSEDDAGSIWGGLVSLAEELFAQQVLVWSVQGQDSAILGQGADSANPRLVKTLVLETLERGETLYVQDFQGSSLEPPIPGFRSALIGIVRGNTEEVGGLLILSNKRAAFGAEHLKLCELVAQQASSALVGQSIARQLGQEKKMAAVGNMAAGLSHELNNPLGALQLSIDSALDTIDLSPKAAGRLLSKASRALARARTLNENFLRYAEESKLKSTEVMSLNEIVSEVLEELEHVLLQVTVVFSPDRDFLVRGRRHDIESLMNNLILNATDAMQESEVKKLEVLCQSDGPGTYLIVRDTGSGIEQKIKERIFEPFFTTKAVGEGWGLGLSVCKQIVDQHGGEISLRSLPEGTEVVIQFPLESGDDEH